MRWCKICYTYSVLHLRGPQSKLEFSTKNSYRENRKKLLFHEPNMRQSYYGDNVTYPVIHTKCCITHVLFPPELKKAYKKWRFPVLTLKL